MNPPSSSARAGYGMAATATASVPCLSAGGDIIFMSSCVFCTGESRIQHNTAGRVNDCTTGGLAVPRPQRLDVERRRVPVGHQAAEPRWQPLYQHTLQWSGGERVQHMWEGAVPQAAHRRGVVDEGGLGGDGCT